MSGSMSGLFGIGIWHLALASMSGSMPGSMSGSMSGHWNMPDSELQFYG
jgi:hypothetical protein